MRPQVTRRGDAQHRGTRLWLARLLSGPGGGGQGPGCGFGGDQGRGPGKARGKSAGKMKAHDESGKELCLSWTNRVGDCDNLPPKAPCPKGRVHKCQVYLSPEHRASTRPQRPKV